MDQVTDCTKALIRAIRHTEEYRRYAAAKKTLQDDPGLKKKIDEYRLRILQLQESGQDLFEQGDALLLEFDSLFRNPLSAEYLEAESSVCRLFQHVVRQISQEMAVELPVSGQEPG